MEATKEELEQYISGQYSDPKRNDQLGSPGYVPPPTTQFDRSPPRLSEVRAVIKKARSASAPGPTSYTRTASPSAEMPIEAHERSMEEPTHTIGVAESLTSHNISQFRSIALLNVEGKIFFTVMA